MECMVPPKFMMASVDRDRGHSGGTKLHMTDR